MNSDMFGNIDDLYHLIQSVNANEEQIQEISDFLNNMSVKNKNKENIIQKIIKKNNTKNYKYLRFLESSSINGLIYSPTQVGKSNATCEFIKSCFKLGVPVIVSTDNKTDQCEQLYTRIEKDLSGANVKMMKVTDKTFGHDIKKCIETGNFRFVIFCLDNASQIHKLIEKLCYFLTMLKSDIHKFKKIAVVHDEADQITKDIDTEQINKEQAESHKKWLELINLINKDMGFMDLKRVFVTATPENTVLLYNIKSPDVISLDIPSNYVGYNDINCIEFEDDLDIKDILQYEVKRIKSSSNYEVILYCIDRKVIDGHEKVLDCLSSYLKCIINTYNGNGITAWMRTIAQSKKFEMILKTQNIQYRRNYKIFTIKKLSIRKFYTFCKQLGETCVVTIGKDLINRGISYVSEDINKPLTATTMIYKPGMSMHAVGICQTIGRITGCAMSKLERTLYAPKDVIDTYKKYNTNQQNYINKIKKDKNLTKEVINNMVFEKLSRNLDRSKLGLKMNTKTKSEHENEYETMKKLIDMWWNADSIISKIMHFVYESEIGVSETELKDFIKSVGSNNIQSHYEECTRNDKNRNYNLVFERSTNKITKLTKQAQKYINSF